MLTDYVEPARRYVACPNQDVVYGKGITALDECPVVVQVPDFGTCFWVYEIIDFRTDSFADIGAMYSTEPVFICSASRNGEVRFQIPFGSIPESRSRLPDSSPRVQFLRGPFVARHAELLPIR
jgi:Protein of unknown function (DUF1254)